MIGKCFVMRFGTCSSKVVTHSSANPQKRCKFRNILRNGFSRNSLKKSRLCDYCNFRALCD